MYKNCSYTPEAIQASGVALSDIQALDSFIWNDYLQRDNVPHVYSYNLTVVAEMLMQLHWQHHRQPGYYPLYWNMLQQIATVRAITTETELVAALDMHRLNNLRRYLKTISDYENGLITYRSLLPASSSTIN
jgi:hypothetical protein